MSRIGLLDDGVVYPTSDDQPMAETPVHGDCMMYVTSGCGTSRKRQTSCWR